MAIRSWISKQLTGLAEAYGEHLTLERVEIYVAGLVDIQQERLKIAFQSALYSLKWFPKLAEIRELAGSSGKDEKKVEAQAAWDFINQYLREWGVDRAPVYSAGRWITAPRLDPRLDYAVRQIGGLWRLNQITDESYPFIFRDFCEAYELAPVAELMEDRLLGQFNIRELAGKVRELTGVARQPETAKDATPGSDTSLRQTSVQNIKPSQAAGHEIGSKNDSRVSEFPRPELELTPARREELRQRLATEVVKRGIPPTISGL